MWGRDNLRPLREPRRLVLCAFITLSTTSCAPHEKADIDYVRRLFAKEFEVYSSYLNVPKDDLYVCRKKEKDNIFFTSGIDYQFEFECEFDVRCGLATAKYVYTYYIDDDDRIVHESGTLLWDNLPDDLACYRRD